MSKSSNQTMRFIEFPKNRDSYQSICIIGSKEQMQAQLAHLSEYPQWQPMIEALQTSRGDSLQGYVDGKKVFFYVPPKEASRNLSPSRSDAVGDWIKKALGDSQTLILLCPSEIDFLQPWVCAIAKNIPLFSAKTKAKKTIIDLALATEDQSALKEVKAWAEQVQKAAFWVDQPPESFNVDQMVQAAQEIAKQYKCEIEIIRGEELEQKGFGGLWNVGKAANQAPALVVLKGSSKGKSPNQVWVGKGIMFDTGGLSLKEKTSMVGMKNDMGGAAAVLSAFELACRRKKQKNLCAVLCLAENAIGPKAFRNDDIIELYSNRTIEINNTDAEGRLVLGDGVAYAVKHLNPSRIVDMATLTGAQLVATGKKHAAILCKDEKLEQEVLAYGRLCGDLVYPLLYCPELLNREFASEVADLKNSVRDRNNAQSSCAGHFIEMQLSTYQGEWLHIDIAGPAWSSERGTGYGVALLNMFI